VIGRRRRERTGTSRSFAVIADNKRKVEIMEGKFIDRKKVLKIKFDDFAQEYLDLYCKPNCKSWKTTHEGNLNILKRSLSGMYLHEITPIVVEKFKLDRLKEVNKKGKPLNSATINRQLNVLKGLFRCAIDWGKFKGENPVRKVKTFKENNARLRYLESEELVTLLSNCHDHLKAAVIVAVYTGMRRSEILGLKWKDCDFKRNIIYLWITKNGEKREVPMSEAVKKALINVSKNPESEFIFCNKVGAQIKDIKKSFFTAVQKSGIKDFHFHDLRHTFASYMVMNGTDLNTVRELLGHKSLTMTLRYAHLSPNHKTQAMDSLSKKIDTFWTPGTKTESREEVGSFVNH
jgi:integrase